MNFKTQEEKTAALFALPSSPPAGTGNVDEWIEGIEKQQKEIENATVGESAAEVKDSPKPPEGNLQQEAPKPPEQTSPEPTDSQADGVFQFTIKKDELPPELKAYKSPDEILKQFAHARSYANKAEETVKRLQAEKDALLAQREVLVKPPDQKEREIETQVRDIQKELDFSKLDDDDYIPGKQFKEFNKIVLEKLEQAEKKYHDIANEFASIKTDSNKRSKELEEQRLLENTKRGIDELLEKNPELKASKPLFVLQANDSVEADVAKYADRILMSKYGNDKPTWQQRNAVINAVLSGDPEITAYCSNNALTPESVGTTIDDVRKYAIVVNVDANMKGQEIDRYTGERKQKLSPYNNQPVNFGSYVEAYENLKYQSGITQEQYKKALSEAEKRGQQNMATAMENRATAPKTLGAAGSILKDATVEMTPAEANAYLNSMGVAEKIQTLGRLGDYSEFNKYNKALKALGLPIVQPDEDWPQERKRS